MAATRHQGGCHCGAVRYSVELDLSQATTKCNCTYCLKVRAWSAPVKPSAFSLAAGADAMASYHRHEQAPIKHFCRTCGITVFGEGDADYMGGPFIMVFVNTLDDVPDEELAAAPVHFCNGRDKLWQESPEVTSYL